MPSRDAATIASAPPSASHGPHCICTMSPPGPGRSSIASDRRRRRGAAGQRADVQAAEQRRERRAAARSTAGRCRSSRRCPRRWRRCGRAGRRAARARTRPARRAAGRLPWTIASRAAPPRSIAYHGAKSAPTTAAAREQDDGGARVAHWILIGAAAPALAAARPNLDVKILLALFHRECQVRYSRKHVGTLSMRVPNQRRELWRVTT